ncbi:hypothetical protein SADUNF_Sadunf04G0064500 [Salix dunnii]|uniref:Alpha/beta hydrolase fold-3 domain-containing protein n=1 Tax=Salix dunnii TaxID=1413687 RepID=A0A835KF27_9ROSI|nr:hypothetical protein SADUNF_Sadunf04G0064500 [Salix dunnii]
MSSETLAPAKLVIPWRTRLAIAVLSVVTDMTRRSDGTINRCFLNLLDFKSSPSPEKPVHSVFSSDITVDTTRNLWFRLYNPENSGVDDGGPASLPVLIFFHGGGFSFLSAASRSYDAVCRRLAHQIPAVVLSVNYRLTPEHRYPCQYDDGFDVLEFVDKNEANGSLPPEADLSKCFLVGDSAGGNLAHHVAVRACRVGFQNVKVIGLVSIQPYFGGQDRTKSELQLVGYPFVSVERTDWCWKVFLPDGSDRDHHAVNVSGPNAENISDLDFPDTIVFVCGLDPLQDWHRRYYEWLRRSGKEATLIEYSNMFHAFYIFPDLPESSRLFSEVKEFVDKRLSRL